MEHENSTFDEDLEYLIKNYKELDIKDLSFYEYCMLFYQKETINKIEY